MKAISASLVLLCVVLCGCSIAPITKTIGRDFDETKVSQIKKGVTTADGVLTLLGEPNTKQFLSTNQVMWHYTYRNEVKTDEFHWVAPIVERTSGVNKNLDLLLQDGIVINFAYAKAPIWLEEIYSNGSNAQKIKPDSIAGMLRSGQTPSQTSN